MPTAINICSLKQLLKLKKNKPATQCGPVDMEKTELIYGGILLTGPLNSLQNTNGFDLPVPTRFGKEL